jgi:hypothetical protein
VIYNTDSMTRFIAAAVKLAMPEATTGTLGDTCGIGLPDGQAFEFTVRELDPAQDAAKTAEGGEA